MPITIQTYDAEARGLVPVEFYAVAEVAAMLHMSESTVRRRQREGRWSHLRLGTDRQVHRYMSAEMIGEAVDEMTQVVGPIPEDPPRLGTPVLPSEIESVR